MNGIPTETSRFILNRHTESIFFFEESLVQFAALEIVWIMGLLERTCLLKLLFSFITHNYWFSRNPNFQKLTCFLLMIIFMCRWDLLEATYLDKKNSIDILQDQIRHLYTKNIDGTCQGGQNKLLAYNVCIFRRQRGKRVGVSWWKFCFFSPNIQT